MITALCFFRFLEFLSGKDHVSDEEKDAHESQWYEDDSDEDSDDNSNPHLSPHDSSTASPSPSPRQQQYYHYYYN